jgi:hypothetical protein
MTVYTDWEQVDADEVAWPDNLEVNSHFAFRKKGTSCLLSFVEIENEWRDHYTQAAFFPRIENVDDNQINLDWYAPNENLPDNFEFMGRNHRFIPGEIIIDHTNYGALDGWAQTNAFLVFDEEEQPFSVICERDVIDMLSSIRERLEETTISTESIGEFFIARTNDSEAGLRALFRPEGSDQTFKLGDFGQIPFEPILYEDILYLVTDGKINTYNILSNQMTNLPIRLENGVVVNAMHIADDRLFYLAGLSCTDYRAKCNNTLYEYDFESQQSHELANDLRSREIAGLESDVLYMWYGDGDAGCFWSSTESYSFASGEVVEGESFSSCEGDPENESIREAYLSYREDHRPYITNTRSLWIENRDITPLEMSELDRGQEIEVVIN